MTGTGFRKIANVAASTRRMSTVNGTTGLAGTSGSPYLTNLYITRPAPLSTPVSARNDVTMLSPILEDPFEMMQTYIEGNPDIKKGDTVVALGEEYPVAFVEPWNFRSDLRLRLILHKPDDR